MSGEQPNQIDEAMRTSVANDYLATIAAKLTWNGAYNVRETILYPDPDIPRRLNGGRRLSTGLGKWTTLAADGVYNNILACGLIEDYNARRHLGRGEVKPIMVPVLNDLGMEVAAYLDANWDQLLPNFRDFCSKYRTRRARF